MRARARLLGTERDEPVGVCTHTDGSINGDEILVCVEW